MVRHARFWQRPGRQRCQSAVEFLVAFPALVLLVFGIIQAALLYQGRATLNYATMLAARAGALHNGDPSAMRNALSRGLAPLFAGKADATGFAEALAKATAETASGSNLTEITVLNPTRAAITDFGRARLDSGAGHELPNDTLTYRTSAAGAASGISVQDANLLHVRVAYCYRLIVPVLDRMLHAAVNTLTPAPAAGTGAGGAGMRNPFGIGAAPLADPCANPLLPGRRIHIRSEAIVRMQSPFFESNLAGSTLPGTPAPPPDTEVPPEPPEPDPEDPGTPTGPGTPTNPTDPVPPGGPVC